MPVETGGSAAWGPNADWNWAGVGIVSSNQWSFPTASEKYAIEWTVGPMTVTTPGNQGWGDIAMQFLIVSANAVRSSGDAAGFWSAAKGVLGVELVYKGGANPSASFGWKNDTNPANSGKQTAPRQVANQINPAISHTLRIEFTSSDASLYVDGTLSQTVPLATMGLGNGPGEEFENGWYVTTGGAAVDNGRGTLSADYVRVSRSPLLPPVALYEDTFADGDLAVNTYAGNQIGGGGYNLTEIPDAGGQAGWGPDAGWNWANQSIMSLDEWPFPAPTNRYGIEWKIGPMTITTSGSASWGDIRHELRLVPASAGRGTGDSTEFWSSSKGTLGVQVIYKQGQNVYADFGWKNDTYPASSGKQAQSGQINNKIDPSQTNIIRLEFDSENVALYVNGVLSQTVPLSAMDLNDEFANGWYLCSWGATADNGRGSLSVDYVRVDRSTVTPAAPTPPVIVQQPASATLFAGEIATFKVSAGGTRPLSYQWQRNGTDILNATNISYQKLSVPLSDNGATYRVKVSNPVLPTGVFSDPATLTVLTGAAGKVSLSFSEGTGTTTANLGSLGGTATFVQTTNSAGANLVPVLSTNAPAGAYAPTANKSSVDFGVIGDGEGGRAIDLAGTVVPTMGSMGGFTACGWLNVAQIQAGFGGNRILFALASPAGPGFDIVQLSSGALQLGVNAWPDGSPAVSSALLTEDANLGTGNWMFFAVTYDGTQTNGNVSWYFGKGDAEAALDVINDYDKGLILTSGTLTLGNFGAVVGARNELGTGGGSRCFRGLMDEINVFSKVLTLAEIQAVQKAPAKLPPIPLTAKLQGNQIVISWNAASGYQLQSRTDLSTGNWADNNATVNVSGSVSTVQLPATGPAQYFRLRNQ